MQKKSDDNKGAKLYLVLISIHGLIRGNDLELGRDADTGGQVTYVVELLRALAQHPDIARVDLLTRRINDSNVASDYAVAVETLSPKARIIRINAGPEEYLAKEALWDHLDNFVDNAIDYLHQQPHPPNLLHSHYADAGYVGSRLSHALGIPLVHTGHSLGRVKRLRLLASGMTTDSVDERYNMVRRIEAEELTLASAERVITSTFQEIEEQYELYDFYQPNQMRVIPPGTDLTRFHPPKGDEGESSAAAAINRFLRHPDRPIILALSRPDARKNIAALVIAYGEDKELQQTANLVIVAGNREDIQTLDSGAQEVLNDILYLIDRYDLYGKVAYPKHHNSEDVPVFYRLTALSQGVFVNPALTEPFGLTLIEAAASGLPIVATEDGGPRDIIGNCKNGILINPLDYEDISRGLRQLLLHPDTWKRYAEAGLTGVRRYYAWSAHADNYLQEIRAIAEKSSPPLLRVAKHRRRMLYHDRALFTDLDQNLLGDPDSLPALLHLIHENRKCITFGIATGRSLHSALRVMRQYKIPEPDLLITSLGTAIHYGSELTEDKAWRHHIERHWTPRIITRTLDGRPGLIRQPATEQGAFKISYFVDPQLISYEEIVQLLHQEDQSVNTFFSFGQFLDIVPLRASKGLALRYVSSLWKIPLDHILAAGGSGADEDMMRGNTLAVVVGNRHHEELSQLEELDRVYFAKAPGAGGILEAIDHYDFLNSCQVKHESE
ncbi:MAG: HAD-IIB family hydrolase [Gammaproteobacteria bacterium]|nr:HAD-IIB family hydrolase [Gammaproteobacteria bacterium]